MQVNVNHTIKADSSSNIAGSYIFDINKNLRSTHDLLPGVLDNTKTSFINSKQKIDKITVNALRLDEKTIIIKGYNETVDNVLLNTISLENIQNINISSSSSYGIDIVPVTVDVSSSDEIVQLVDTNDADIQEYEVLVGDTLSSIAIKFNITVDTILWANDLNSKSGIRVGQKLVILPVSGISYKVKSGDSVSGLATKFNVTERDIVDFNKTNDNKLVIGESIIIPGAKLKTKVPVNVITNPDSAIKPSTVNIKTGSMAKPIGGGAIKTQGLHGHNGIDFGAPVGTQVYSALDGVVTLVRDGDGWNGGYGNYIVIKHNNGVQTLYAHLDSISVSQGQTLSKGEVIARSGNTGQSTGPHLHFEVRGSRNPF